MINYSLLLKNVSIIGKTNYKYPEKDDLNTCSVVLKYFFLKKKRAAGLTIIRKGIDNWAVKKKVPEMFIQSWYSFFIQSLAVRLEKQQITDAFSSQVMGT